MRNLATSSVSLFWYLEVMIQHRYKINLLLKTSGGKAFPAGTSQVSRGQQEAHHCHIHTWYHFQCKTGTDFILLGQQSRIKLQSLNHRVEETPMQCHHFCFCAANDELHHHDTSEPVLAPQFLPSGYHKQLMYVGCI